MLLDAKETLRLAEMLRLNLSESEAERFSHDMSSILDYARLLNDLDVADVDPMGVGLCGYAPLREDAPQPSLACADIQSFSGGAFNAQLGAFVIKPIFT